MGSMERRPEVWQTSNGNWYTKAEWQAWQTSNAEQAPQAHAAEQRDEDDPAQPATAAAAAATAAAAAAVEFATARRPEVWQASDGNWYTEAEWQAWQTGKAEQAPPARAAEQRGASEPPQPAAAAELVVAARRPEVWRASDGKRYTRAEWQAWQASNAEHAPHAFAAEQHGAADPPQPAEAAAAEPAAEQLWGPSHFVTTLLPQNRRAVCMPPCNTLRGLLEAAHTHRQHLPLPADVFFQGDICAALGCYNPVAVTMERINSVKDPNRGGHERIDLLVYDRSGAVTRHHPGRRPAEDARPHMIPHVSRTYNRSIAMAMGVGAALHVHSPIMEAWRATAHPSMEEERIAAAEHDEPPPLVTADDLADINPLDSKLINVAALADALASLQPGETNWSREGFPWWVFMAGRLHMFRQVVAQGIIRVTAVNTRQPTPYMRVSTLACVRIVRVSRGRVRLE